MSKSKTTEVRPMTGAERQRAYEKRMRNAGFYRAVVWVPGERKAQFDRLVADLQDEWADDKLYPS